MRSGARDWPVGYTGSVSHKGTKVVAALTRIGRVTSVGIDIETLDGCWELAEDQIASDELSVDLGLAGPVILLSAKEAVFKALNPVVGIRFGFEEVQIVRKEVASKKLLGIAHFRRHRVDVRCSTFVPSWVTSVALLPQQQIFPKEMFDFRTPWALDLFPYGTRPLDVKRIRPGGYESLDDMISHLVPAMMKDSEADRESSDGRYQ